MSQKKKIIKEKKIIKAVKELKLDRYSFAKDFTDIILDRNDYDCITDFLRNVCAFKPHRRILNQIIKTL